MGAQRSIAAKAPRALLRPDPLAGDAAAGHVEANGRASSLAASGRVADGGGHGLVF